MALPMKTIWQARRLILEGCSVAQVCEITGMSKSSVTLYTKAERAKVKQQNEARKNRKLQKV